MEERAGADTALEPDQLLGRAVERSYAAFTRNRLGRSMVVRRRDVSPEDVAAVSGPNPSGGRRRHRPLAAPRRHHVGHGRRPPRPAPARVRAAHRRPPRPRLRCSSPSCVTPTRRAGRSTSRPHWRTSSPRCGWPPSRGAHPRPASRPGACSRPSPSSAARSAPTSTTGCCSWPRVPPRLSQPVAICATYCDASRASGAAGSACRPVLVAPPRGGGPEAGGGSRPIGDHEPIAVVVGIQV